MSSWLQRTADREVKAHLRTLLGSGYLGPEAPALIVYELDTLASRLKELQTPAPTR